MLPGLPTPPICRLYIHRWFDRRSYLAVWARSEAEAVSHLALAGLPLSDRIMVTVDGIHAPWKIDPAEIKEWWENGTGSKLVGGPPPAEIQHIFHIGK